MSVYLFLPSSPLPVGTLFSTNVEKILWHLSNLIIWKSNSAHGILDLKLLFKIKFLVELKDLSFIGVESVK